MTLTRRSFLGAAVVCRRWRRAARRALLPPERAILILISIDGFRADYLDRLQPPTLSKLAAEGVRADGLDPAVSVEDLPEPLHHRHRPDARASRHHLEQHARRRTSPANSRCRTATCLPIRAGGAASRSGTPPRGRAEKPRAMFWPGSETVIGGRQATYWTPFDDNMPHSERVSRILDWLQPAGGRAPVVSDAVFQRRRQRRTQPRARLARTSATP